MNPFNAFECRFVGCNDNIHSYMGRYGPVPINYCKKHYDDLNSITICTVHNCRNMVVPGYTKCTSCFVQYNVADKFK